MASLIIGTNIRFTAKPGESLTLTTFLLSVLPTVSIVFIVSSEVVKAIFNSIKGITGTGLKKCKPITLSGRLVAPAIFVIDREEVLEARIVCFGACLSNSLKILDRKSVV